MLQIVPPNYLWGLHDVVLTNVQALSRKERDQKTWGRRRIALGEALGYYTPEWHGEPARITILVDNLEKHWGRGKEFVISASDTNGVRKLRRQRSIRRRS